MYTIHNIRYFHMVQRECFVNVDVFCEITKKRLLLRIFFLVGMVEKLQCLQKWRKMIDWLASGVPQLAYLRRINKALIYNHAAKQCIFNAINTIRWKRRWTKYWNLVMHGDPSGITANRWFEKTKLGITWWSLSFQLRPMFIRWFKLLWTRL